MDTSKVLAQRVGVLSHERCMDGLRQYRSYLMPILASKAASRVPLQLVSHRTGWLPVTRPPMLSHECSLPKCLRNTTSKIYRVLIKGSSCPGDSLYYTLCIPSIANAWTTPGATKF